MNNNRLTLTIATVFSLLLNLPRVIFLLTGKSDPAINSAMEVTLEDTIIRILLLFGFSYLALTINLTWSKRISEKYKVLALIALNASLFFVSQFLFYLIDQFFFNIYASVLSPGVNALVYFFILLILILISTAIQLINKSRLDAIEKEVLKQKSLSNELEALKNQINPHFLFNSLSTLSLLVREDQKAAIKFINKLSFLFRYILLSQDKELVSVKEELKVLDSYVHLIKQRYQNNFDVKTNIKNDMLEKRIPILSLQLLMENAIKHNEISAKKPLYVELYDEENRIVMKNVLQKRNGHIESTQIGLKNLNARTILHMNKETEISKNDTHFIVKIPTL